MDQGANMEASNDRADLNSHLKRISKNIPILLENIKDLEGYIKVQKYYLKFNEEVVQKYENLGLENMPPKKHKIYLQVISNRKDLRNQQKVMLNKMEQILETGQQLKEFVTKAQSKSINRLEKDKIYLLIKNNSLTYFRIKDFIKNVKSILIQVGKLARKEDSIEQVQYHLDGMIEISRRPPPTPDHSSSIANNILREQNLRN